MNTCIISVGSNIDPEENVRRAIDMLSSELTVIGTSEFIKTTPIGITNQADFINGAVKIETVSGMEPFRQYLKKLEDRLGRDRNGPKYGPRSIDLDILIWNGKIVDEDYFTRDFLRNTAAELGFQYP